MIEKYWDRQIDVYRPELPPTNSKFGTLSLVSPGVYKTKYIETFPQTKWGWCRMTDLGYCLKHQQLLMEGDAHPSIFFLSSERPIELFSKFGQLLEIDGEKEVPRISYITIDQNTDHFHCRFNVRFHKDTPLKLGNLDPYLLFVPSGWAEAVISFVKKGIHNIDEKPPEHWTAYEKPVSYGRVLYAHAQPERHDKNWHDVNQDKHYEVRNDSSSGFNWKLHRIYNAKGQL